MDTSLYDLKGQARRLERGLKSLEFPVTHSQALDLLAQVHGKRDWKELAGLASLSPKASETAVAQAAAAHTAQRLGTPEEMLETLQTQYYDDLFYIEAYLWCHDASDDVLDELVHDFVNEGSQQASTINNHGFFEQLLYLLRDAGGGHPAQLKQLLQDQIHWLDFDMPGIPATLSVPNLPSVEFDALPWFIQTLAPSIQGLLEQSRHDIGNCDAGDDIGLWSMTHGRPHDRQALAALVAANRAQQQVDPSLIGITVRVQAEPLRRFLEVNFVGSEHYELLLATVNEFCA